MLATDKQLLLTELKQNTTALKQKEFNLHHSNLMTVGTQAAVLAGLDVVMFIEFAPPPNSEWGDLELVARVLKFFYYITIISAFCANMIVVAHTTSLSVLAGSLALRGPDGSMITATDGLYEERKAVYPVFRVGLAFTVGSVMMGVWLILNWEAALVCMLVAMYTCLLLYKHYIRFKRRFSFDKTDTVDFTDIFEGHAAIQGIPLLPKRRRRQSQRNGYKEVKQKESTSSSSSDEHEEEEGECGLEMMENGTSTTKRRSPNQARYNRTSSAPISFGSFFAK